MVTERINVNMYIPYYTQYQSQTMAGGAFHVFLKGDREIHTDAVRAAIVQNLQQLGFDPNATVQVVSKAKKHKKPRMNITVEQAANPHTFKWRPSLRFVVVRMPEAGFTLTFSRNTLQVIQRADWTFAEPFPLFARDYLRKIDYPTVLNTLAKTNYQVRQWIVHHWTKIKDIDKKRLLVEKFHERRATPTQTG